MALISRTDMFRKTLVMLLAGGQGERLYPLTRDRAKPAVPFGGVYRIIDFTLSNCVNSGFRKVEILTQYKSLSLQRHIQMGWSIFRPELDEHLYVIPPQQRGSTHWYLGTADAIFQNIYTLERERPQQVLILAGDHVYKMNYGPMLERHLAKEADLTVACIPVPCARAAGQLGVAIIDKESRIVEFQEKPENPAEIPGRPGICLCSMGVYIFRTEILVREVVADAKTDSAHDFGKNVIPGMIARRAGVYAHPFTESEPGKEPYWRDIGTLDAYWEANFDLVQVSPAFNLYDKDWPIRTYQPPSPPAKTVFNEASGRQGRAVNSLVSSGCIISGSYVEESVLSPDVYIHSYADLRQCVVLDEVEVGRGARLKKAIIDKRVRIPEGAVIGYDLERDRARFTVSPGGVVIVPGGVRLEP